MDYAGHNEPMRIEADIYDLVVEGEIPKEINGVFYRSVPDPQYPPSLGDDVFISGGVNVHPREVESCLAGYPGVADVAVTALADPVWGDALVALVVGSAEAASIHDWSRRHLASAQRPRRIVRVENLPRNPMGKIERSALRALAGEVA